MEKPKKIIDNFVIIGYFVFCACVSFYYFFYYEESLSPNGRFLRRGADVYYVFDFGIHKNLRIENMDFESVKVLNDYYIKDKNKVYFKVFEVKAADPNTFKVIKGEYAKDKNNCYVAGGVIEMRYCYDMKLINGER